MTIRTVLWRRFIKQNRLALNLALQGMAHRTAHIFVRSCQWKLSAFIVVERRRGPPLFNMATPTFCNSVLSNELVAVRIRMTSLTIRRRSFELNFVGTGGNLVTFITCDRAMSPDQCKFRSRMVEAPNVDPRSGVVTAFTPQRSPIGTLLCHPRLEFTLMGIHVTRSARAVLKMERQYLVRSSPDAYFMALRAGDSRMGPSKYEACVLVFGNRECRAMKVFYGMANFASILVWRSSKLLVMS